MSCDPDLLVLVVEDDFVDQEFVRRTLTGIEDTIRLVFKSNAESALDFLNKQTFKDHRKKLIFLDINLPLMSGIDLLHELRKSGPTAKTVIYMLTSSDANSDIRSAYDECIAGYLVKSDLNDAKHSLVSLVEFYRDLNVFPDSSR